MPWYARNAGRIYQFEYNFGVNPCYGVPDYLIGLNHIHADNMREAYQHFYADQIKAEALAEIKAFAEQVRAEILAFNHEHSTL